MEPCGMDTTRIELASAEGARAFIIPGLGGWLTEFSVQLPGVGRVHAIHHDEEVVARYPREMWAGMPLLFPLVSYNHLAGQEHAYEWAGKRYPMPQHGFARRKPWRLEYSDASNVSISLSADEETLAVYPWNFRYDLTFRLEATVLRWEQRIANRSDSPMPFSAGFHPYFRVPFLPGSQRSDCVVRCPEGIRFRPTGGALCFEQEPFRGQLWPVSEDVNGTLLLGDLGNREFSLIDRTARAEVRFSWEGAPRYPYCAIWSRTTNAPFYCIEPWTSLPNSFRRGGAELIILAPGEAVTSRFELEVRKSA